MVLVHSTAGTDWQCLSQLDRCRLIVFELHVELGGQFGWTEIEPIIVS